MSNSDPKTPPAAPEVESPIDPVAIAEARRIVAQLTEMIDSGDVEQIACYVGRRDGTYQVMQNLNCGRHADAGRLMEFALMRLGFMQREDIKDMIDGE